MDQFVDCGRMSRLLTRSCQLQKNVSDTLFCVCLRSADRRKSIRWLINNRHDCQSFPSSETGCSDHQSAAISELVPDTRSDRTAFRSDGIPADGLSDPGPAVGGQQFQYPVREQPFFNVKPHTTRSLISVSVNQLSQLFFVLQLIPDE